MLVGPPEQLKTQFISMLEDYPRTLVLSDLTTRELADFSQELGTTYKTLGFTAFEKISQRSESVSVNLIGHLTALAEEGFRGSYKSDRRQRTYKARVLLVGAVPQYYYNLSFKDWMESGFHRRFLWPQFHLSDPDVIKHSIIQWKPINLRAGSFGFPIPSDSIPFDITEEERMSLSKLLRAAEGIASPLILLSKIYCVLRWRYGAYPGASEIAMAILRDFSESLQKIADLEIGAVPELEALTGLISQQEMFRNDKKQKSEPATRRTKKPKLQSGVGKVRIYKSRG